MKFSWIIGNGLALFGLITAGYYLTITRKPGANHPPYLPRIGDHLGRIQSRRRFGAVVMALIAGMFLVAINGFSNVRTIPMIAFWMLLLVLVFWLLVLALLDLLDVRKLKGDVLDRTQEKFKSILNDSVRKENSHQNQDQP